MKTTAKVLALGLYKSACCDQEVLFDRDDCFSRCPACERLCFWELVEPVVSWLDLQDTEQQAA
jgi:hypothetical protein